MIRPSARATGPAAARVACCGLRAFRAGNADCIINALNYALGLTDYVIYHLLRRKHITLSEAEATRDESFQYISPKFGYVARGGGAGRRCV